MTSRRFRRIRERLVHATPWWHVWDDDVELPNGTTGRHLRLTPTIAKPGAVAVVTRHAEGVPQVALVRQWRYAQDAAMWEFPRGFADDDDASLAATAAREAAEETGATVLAVRELGTVCPDSSIFELRVGVFHVEVETTPAISTHAASTDRSGLDEVDEVRWVSFEELRGLVSAGEVVDGFSLAALGLLFSHQEDSMSILPAPTALDPAPLRALEP